MRHSTLLRLSSLAACVVMAMASLPAHAYPVKPIRLIVPNAPGGGTDTIARSIAEKVGPALGQQIIVDNRAGGGGRIAAELVARSPKDGYTILQGSNSALITGPAMYSKLNYDPIKDFAPISLAATTAYILAAHPSVPARSVKEVIVLAKTKKGSLTYGSTGPGSAAHLGMELLEAMTKIKLIHVPFKGSVPAMLSLTQGEIDVMFGNYQATLSLIRAGRLRALGQSSLKRASFAPDIPTIDESGLPGFEMQQFYSVVAPAGTPREVIQRLNQEIVKHLPSDDVRKRLSAEGIEITVSTPEEFGKLMASELEKWTKIIRAAGVKVD
ncbi:MAG: tripartite tricarboxylate transporter substrate binding protein [Burkholderiales bacterium]|nr:tripartite tricarboxylate transporter substrate binding protein [Burkholderiales bacterium]